MWRCSSALGIPLGSVTRPPYRRPRARSRAARDSRRVHRILSTIARMSEARARIAEINRFPVKSMAGELIPAAALDPLGIPGDRRFAVRDLDTDKILSAKRPAVGRLLLDCAAWTDDSGVVRIRVRDREYPATDTVGLDAALSAHLGCRAKLESTVTGDEAYESYWPEIEGLALSDVTVDFPIAMSTDKGTFVDLAALHVITSSSVRHLARLTPGSEISTARFRPSMVCELDEDVDEFIENSWAERTARVGESRWQFGPASPRCVMTTLAQAGLPDDRAVLRSIAAHNRLEMAGFGNFACLGVYAEVVEPGLVRVGDEIIFDA